MRLSVEHVFGPQGNGISCANDSLSRFLRLVHANWDEASRSRAPHLVRPEVRPIAEQLAEVRLNLRERMDLGSLHMLGLDYEVEFGAQMSAASVSALRKALPLSGMFTAGLVAVDLEHLQHDRPSLAALEAFHSLLLRTEFWETELADVDLATLGVYSALDPYLCIRTEPDVFLGEFKKLNAATGLGDFHVLDVLSRLFSDQYLFAGLRAGAIELVPEKLLHELR